MIYITGDTPGDFRRVELFCKRFDTNCLPITLFCIHGNHEQRPQTISSYQAKKWHNGTVYYEEEYPNLLFAKDGELFDFNGKQTIVIGGAYSIDKMVRLLYGYGWWADEQPSDEIKAYVEQQLDTLGWGVDVVLSHTAPLKYEPVEVFLPGINQRTVDKSTEIWLDKIEDRLKYWKWYCSHYHTAKKIDRLEIMFENFDIFCGRQ